MIILVMRDLEAHGYDFLCRCCLALEKSTFTTFCIYSHNVQVSDLLEIMNTSRFIKGKKQMDASCTLCEMDGRLCVVMFYCIVKLFLELCFALM